MTKLIFSHGLIFRDMFYINSVRVNEAMFTEPLEGKKELLLRISPPRL